MKMLICKIYEKRLYYAVLVITNKQFSGISSKEQELKYIALLWNQVKFSSKYLGVALGANAQLSSLLLVPLSEIIANK
jgi:hypothetical protein